ncbi:MAG: cation:proton antiporter [Rhodothermales bacterium]
MEFSILNLLFVLLAAWLAGILASRFGYPSVLGELLAGIVLGPPLLGWLDGGPALAVLAEVGILLMMFYIGMEIDPRELKKASMGGFLAAIGGFITPFVLAYLAVVWAGGTAMAGVFVGIAAGVTSLATKSRILVDLQLLDTRIAHVMMAGALIADTLSLILFAGLMGVADTNALSVGALSIVVLKAVVFFAVVILAGLKVFPWVGAQLRRFKSMEGPALFMFFVLVVLLFAELAEVAGMHGILGAFMAGLFLREQALGRAMAKDLVDRVRVVSLGLLAPIFFVTAGFAVSLEVFTTNLGLLAIIVVLATVGKIAGTALFYLPTGHGWREGLTIGAGMNGRGAVEIIVAQIGLAAGLISQEIFSILVFMAIFTTATVPVFLKWGTDWLQRRGELVRTSGERSGYIIVSAGPSARALGKLLARSHPVRLIDRNPAHCDAAGADGLLAIQGNALDEDVLSEAGAGGARGCLVMTANPEVNALVARMAREVFRIPEVSIVGSGDADGHVALTDHLGIQSLFGGPRDLTRWDYRIDQGMVRTSPVMLERPIAGDALVQAVLPEDTYLPLAVERGAAVMPFHSGIALEAGDRIMTLLHDESTAAESDRFDRLAIDCPVLDIVHEIDLDGFFSMVGGVLAPRLGATPEAVTAWLHQREQHHPSVLLPGLAIPHIMIDHAPTFEIVIARSHKGILFPGDPEPVHTVFVLAGPPDMRTTHLRALSAIAQIVQRAGFEADWKAAADSEALRMLVLSAPRRRFASEAPSSERVTAG